MKRIASLLCIWILTAQSVCFGAVAQNNSIGYAGASKNINIASIIQPYLSAGNVIALSGYESVGGTLLFGAFTKWNTNTGIYQVPSNKTFRTTTVCLLNNGSAIGWLLGYATSSFTDQQSGTPTGAVYFSAGASSSSIYNYAINSWQCYPFTPNFPASSYPFYRGQSSSTIYHIILIGTEQ